MRRWLAGLLLLGAWLTVRAEVAVPALSGRVVDQAKLFSADDMRRIDAAIVALEQATGGQMVVWTIPALDGDAIENIGIRAAEKWKVGNKGKDDGAILLIALNDRQIRLEIGYGWEGPVNDAKAGDIIRGMGDFFRRGDYGTGAVYAVNRMQSHITGKEVANAPVPQPAPAESGASGVDIGVIIFMVIFLMIWGARVTRHTGGRGGGGGGGGFGGFGGGGFGGGRGGGGFGGGRGGGFGGGGASGRW